MGGKNFRAYVVEESGSNIFTGSIKKRSIDDLPAGDVLINVKYSSLNYKDALSARGNRGVTRSYPHTPGVDAAGIIEESRVPEFRAGEKVIVTSYDLGMNTPGGFGEYIRVPADWVVKLPETMPMEEAMIFGTAGLAAGVSVSRLIDHVKPSMGEVLVTGSTGGVGSFSVSILAKLGYRVAALTGKVPDQEYLKMLGASRIVPMEELMAEDKRPLLKAQWSGAIDTVGGNILANAIKSINPGGAVTCCGNAASPDLPLTVFPFILRGITLMGVDTQNYPADKRKIIWENLAGPWKIDMLRKIYTEVGLQGLDEKIEQILQGKIKGRVIVNLGG